MVELNVEAVCEQMASAKTGRVVNQRIDGQSDGSVVGCDDRARAHTNDRINRNSVKHQPAQHTGVRRTAQPTRTEHQAQTNTFGRGSGHQAI